MIPVPGYIYIYTHTIYVSSFLLYPENSLYHLFKAAMIDFFLHRSDLHRYIQEISTLLLLQLLHIPMFGLD